MNKDNLHQFMVHFGVTQPDVSARLFKALQKKGVVEFTQMFKFARAVRKEDKWGEKDIIRTVLHCCLGDGEIEADIPSLEQDINRLLCPSEQLRGQNTTQKRHQLTALAETLAMEAFGKKDAFEKFAHRRPAIYKLFFLLLCPLAKTSMQLIDEEIHLE